MHYKILHIAAVTFVMVMKMKAQNVNYNGYLHNNYGMGDSVPAASQYYNPIYTQRQQTLTGLSSQYHELSPMTQDTSYPEYLTPSSHAFQPSYRLTQHPPQHPQPKLYPNPSETVITPVQHSTVIHHAPYLHTINGQNSPFVEKLVYLNGKPPQINIQPIRPSPPLHQRQTHPLQKPLYYQQQPQKLHPSQQVYPHSQRAFLPTRHPQPIRQPPSHQRGENSNDKKSAEENDERESEDVEEEDNSDDTEEKSDLNDENKDSNDSNEEVEKYQDEEDAEEEDEEERPKYTNYSFEFNSPVRQQKGRNKNNDDDNDDDNEDDHRGGYRTHEDVEENDEEDNDEDGSRNKYVKKVPKGFALYKNSKQPIVSNPPSNITKFDYKKITFTTPRPTPKHKTSEPRNKKYKKDDSQSKPSEVIPVTTKHMYREKWYILQKS